MTTLTSIIALLQAVVSLMIATHGTPSEPIAREIAQRAIVWAQQAVAELPTESAPAQPIPEPAPAQTEIQVAPSAAGIINEPKKAMATLEIITPKHPYSKDETIGKTYKAANEVTEDDNTIYIGVILKDSDGNQIDSAVMDVATTDSAQNKQINGTGTFLAKFGKFYPFIYDFHSAGQHVITFTALGASASVTISAN